MQIGLMKKAPFVLAQPVEQVVRIKLHCSTVGCNVPGGIQVDA